MKAKYKNLLLVVACIFLPLFLSSCSNTSSSLKSIGTDSINIPPVNAAKPSLPFNDYILAGNTGATVFYAHTLLVQSCMEKKGFPFQINSLIALEQNPFYAIQIGLVSQTFGVYNLKEAETYGYDSSLSPATSYSNKNMDHVNALENAYRKKYGQPYMAANQSCNRYLGSSNFLTPKLNHVLNTISSLLNNQINDAVSRTERNPVLLSDIKKWSACMATHGYDVKSPPPADISNNSSAPTYKPLTKAEIAEAVTDYKCKVKVNMMNTWLALDAYYQRQTINEHPTQFQEMLQLRSALIAGAKRIMTKY